MQTFLSTPATSLPRSRLSPAAALPSPVSAPPTPPRLPPPCLPVLASQTARDDASDLTEEIRRSLENLDAIIQLHDDGGLTEQEMLNLPAPPTELLDFAEGSPQHSSYAAKPAPPPAPPRRSSIKQTLDLIPDNGHVMTEEEEAGIDQSSRSVADILQKFARANTPPKVPTVPPALRSKSISSPRDPPDVVPPPAAFRSEPAAPPPPPPPDDPSPPLPPSPPAEEEHESEDFGFARLRKLAELSSTTGEDVHKRGVLQRSKTVDVASKPPPPPPEPRPVSTSAAPLQHDTRRSSAPDADEEDMESFAFARLRALAEQKAGAKDDDDSDGADYSDDNDLEIDLSQVPGYTRIDSRCPNWKRGMVEKKNKEAIEAYLKAKEEEERERRKWAHVPAWKRNLVQKKQAEKQPDSPPIAKGGCEDDPNLPSWKRNLVQRRKSNDVESRR